MKLSPLQTYALALLVGCAISAITTRMLYAYARAAEADGGKLIPGRFGAKRLLDPRVHRAPEVGGCLECEAACDCSTPGCRAEWRVSR